LGEELRADIVGGGSRLLGIEPNRVRRKVLRAIQSSEGGHRSKKKKISTPRDTKQKRKTSLTRGGESDVLLPQDSGNVVLNKDVFRERRKSAGEESLPDFHGEEGTSNSSSHHKHSANRSLRGENRQRKLLQEKKSPDVNVQPLKKVPAKKPC